MRANEFTIGTANTGNTTSSRATYNSRFEEHFFSAERRPPSPPRWHHFFPCPVPRTRAPPLHTHSSTSTTTTGEPNQSRLSAEYHSTGPRTTCKPAPTSVAVEWRQFRSVSVTNHQPFRVFYGEAHGLKHNFSRRENSMWIRVTGKSLENGRE